MCSARGEGKMQPILCDQQQLNFEMFAKTFASKGWLSFRARAERKKSYSPSTEGTEGRNREKLWEKCERIAKIDPAPSHGVPFLFSTLILGRLRFLSLSMPAPWRPGVHIARNTPNEKSWATRGPDTLTVKPSAGSCSSRHTMVTERPGSVRSGPSKRTQSATTAES